MGLSPRVLDGHNDTLLDLQLANRRGGRSFLEESEEGHIDLPRAKAAGYGGGFFAILAPSDSTPPMEQTRTGYQIPLANPVPFEQAQRFTHQALARLYRLEQESGGRLRVVRDDAALRDCLDSEAIAAIPHLEGAAAVAPDLSNLDFLYAAGVRSIGLVWSRSNRFATGVPYVFPDEPDTGPGLTETGERLVAGCNRRGILVDLAHLNEAGFWDAAAISDAPLVVSHTAVHSLCPSTRNLTDEQLDAIAETDGVVGISFCVENLHPQGEQDTSLPLETVVDHIEYVAERVGIDHVALGTDFDGATVPAAIGDVCGLPTLFEALRNRGFDEAARAKLAQKNWLRVISETWD